MKMFKKFLKTLIILILVVFMLFISYKIYLEINDNEYDAVKITEPIFVLA